MTLGDEEAAVSIRLDDSGNQKARLEPKWYNLQAVGKVVGTSDRIYETFRYVSGRVGAPCNPTVA